MGLSKQCDSPVWSILCSSQNNLLSSLLRGGLAVREGRSLGGKRCWHVPSTWLRW